jgi:rod shape-determining protein MreD
MRRTLLLAGVIVVSLVLESTVLAHLRVGGVHPDVLVIVVVAVAMTDGPVTGATFGFAAGLVSDLLSANPVGVSALVYTVIGFGVGVGRVYVTSSSTLVHLLLAGAASFVSVWLAGLVLRVFDLSSWDFLLRTAPLVALYNLLLTPLVFPPVRALLERLEPVPTTRW